MAIAYSARFRPGFWRAASLLGRVERRGRGGSVIGWPSSSSASLLVEAARCGSGPIDSQQLVRLGPGRAVLGSSLASACSARAFQ